MSLPVASILVLLAAAVSSLLLTGGLRRALPPGFLAAAVDHRSNHDHAARQIGGLAAVPAAAAVFGLALWFTGRPVEPWLPLGIGVLILWLAGLVDDWRPLGAVVKLAVQLAAASVVVIGGDLQLPYLAALPLPVGQAAAVIVLVWFVNMVNFMDGLDLITVAGAGVPVLSTAALCLLAGGDAAAWLAGLAAAGALGGFAWHNRPQAPVFLGDSGSLPLGLVAGYLALRAGATVSPLLAFLPFAYYLADTVTTLARRALQRKNILAAHSEHAYQVARRAGVPAMAVIARVAAVALIAGLAALLGAVLPPALSVVAVAAGWLAGFWLVFHLRRSAPRPGR